MGVFKILLVIFLVLIVFDNFYFYLGKVGIMKYLRKFKIGNKMYKKVHRKFKKFINSNNYSAVILAKLPHGGAIVGIIYLGEYINYKKFFLINTLINFVYCVAIWILVTLFEISIRTALRAITGVQNLILVALAIFTFFIIDRIFDRKITRYLTKKFS